MFRQRIGPRVRPTHSAGESTFPAAHGVAHKQRSFGTRVAQYRVRTILVRLNMRVAALSLAAGVAVIAQSPTVSAGPQAEANAHFRSGNAAFDGGDFPSAQREYEAAYRETNDPDILFNLAQSARFSNQFEKAKKGYADYLAHFPNAMDRDAVRDEIAQLDDLLKRSARIRVTPPVGRTGGAPTIETVQSPGAGASAAVMEMQPLGSKRVLLLITEQNGPQIVHAWTDVVWTPAAGASTTTAVRAVNELGVLEATLSDRMTEAGFTVVDAEVLKGRMGAPARFEKIVGDDAARTVALHSCADLVLVVKGVGLSTAPTVLAGSGMTSGQGNVTARLIRVTDGVVVAADTEHAAQVNIDPDMARMNALDEAAKMVAAKIGAKANAM